MNSRRDHSITSSARASRRWRHIEAERLGGLEIDDQLDFRGLLDREVAGLCSLENLVDVGRCPAIVLFQLGAVTIKPPASTWSR